ncbi:potassium channel family protein [Marivita sp.]|uniref:potassium channel family protein n=1 Tax=Marivita sp. TaxID=2003365 RepID=UPI003F711470
MDWDQGSRVEGMKNSGNRTFGVVGLGNFGSTVAKELQRFGNHVIGIDISDARVMNLADTLSQTMIVDARDDAALREAGFGDCDVAVVAMGDDLEASILAAINLKLVGVPVVWAKATTKTHHRILSKLGVDRIIHPEVEVGQHIAQVLHNPLVRDYVSLGNGYHVVNFRIPESLEGKSLEDLPHGEKFNLRCIGVMRGTEFVGQDATGCQLERDDLLLLLGQRKDLRNFAASL